MKRTGYSRNVFINCPFDRKYGRLFEAIVFSIHALGFRARCARERLDSGDLRLAKIAELIGVSRYSIHDLSRTKLDGTTGLPRFNMPLELGIDLGCRIFSPGHRDKSLLILDSEKYRYQKYISDIAGQDVMPHGDDPYMAVLQVRSWLRTTSGLSLRGGDQTHESYQRFRKYLPKIRRALRLDNNDLNFADFTFAVVTWLKEQE